MLDYYIDWDVCWFGAGDKLPAPHSGYEYNIMYSQGQDENPAKACGAALRGLRPELEKELGAKLSKEAVSAIMHEARKEAMEFIQRTRADLPWEKGDDMEGVVEVRIEFVPD